MSDSFFQQVNDVVTLIPRGRVTTYGMIAAFLGSKGSARMVGWALNSTAHSVSNIPAHRVVNRQGILTGKHHFGGHNVMADLLISEGIPVSDTTIEELDKYLWDPSANE